MNDSVPATLLDKNTLMAERSAVWLDHKDAHIFSVHPDRIGEAVVLARGPHAHKHPLGPEGPKEHPDDQKHFFRDIARGIDKSSEILIFGPGTAKLQLLKYLHTHETKISDRVIGIESIDHPTNRQLVAYVKEYFHLHDRKDGVGSRDSGRA